jgi:hypothetical protein
MKSIIILITCSLLTTNFTKAQETNQELTKKAQNPIANLISVPFQNNTNFNMGPQSDRTQNILNIQPVIPFADGKIITRTIIPLVWNPDFTQESGSDFGLGDILFTAFYSPESKGFIWGVGPVMSFPSGDDTHGSGKWGIGPSVVMLAMPDKWVLGFIANNVWSFAGDENRADVNFFTLQPFINYNFPQFYLAFSPIITSNWEAENGNQWTLPLGLGIGKLFRFSKLPPINFTVSYFNNVVKPENTADWTLRIVAAVLLPKSIF